MGLSEVYRLTIPGSPTPKGDPKTRIVKSGGKTFPVQYKEKKERVYEAKVAAHAQAAGLVPLEGPIELRMVIYMKRPKRLMRKKDPSGPVPCISRPDTSNILKAVEDGLNGVAWADDQQVCRHDILRVYHEKRGHPRVELLIKAFEMNGEVQVDQNTEGY